MTNLEPVHSASIKLFNSIIGFHKGATSKPEEIAKIKAKYMLQRILLTDAACVEFLNSNKQEERDIIVGLSEYANFNFNDLMKAALFQNFFAAENISRDSLLYIQLAEYLSSDCMFNGWVYDPREYRITSPSKQQVSLKKIDVLPIDEVAARVVSLVDNSSMGLSEETLDALTTLIKGLKIEIDVTKIPNKELRCKIYLLTDDVPSKPIDLLRLMVYIRTGSTMLIKSKSFINTIAITHSDGREYYFLKEFVNKYGVEPLAESFLRYKSFWTALRRKSNNDFIRIVNRIRRVARRCHKPVIQLPLDCVCNAEITGEYIHNLNDAIHEAPIYKLISAYNSLDNHRTLSPKIYHIRNGKGFVKEINECPNAKDRDALGRVLIQELIFKEICNRVAVNLEMTYGKEEIKICLPKKVKYAAPTSEKAFIGAIPYGTTFEFDPDKNPVVGIHWYNHDKGRIDLDLHATSVNFHIGWNNYIDERDNSPFIYSGDITNADPKYGGGTEAFLIKKHLLPGNDHFLVKVNCFYNGNPDKKPQYRLFVASLDNNVKATSKNLIDAKDLAFASVNVTFGEKVEETIGYLSIDKSGDIKFTIQRLSFTDNIVSRSDNLSNLTLEALTNKATLAFDTVLSGVAKYIKITYIDNPEEADIDLSNPFNLATDTFIKIFGK